MHKWLWLSLFVWGSNVSAQTQLESDMLYLQQQVSQLRQTVLEQDSHIAQQNIAIQQLRGELELLEHQVKRLQSQRMESATKQPKTNIVPINNGSMSMPSNQTAALPDDKKAYQRIYLILESGNDEQAINDFQEFLILYPNSQYADDAQFWLAEAYYSKRDFISALVAYEQLVERYPQSAKRAQAELKIAYCYYELKDFTQAKTLLTQIKQSYPSDSVARLASKKLIEMKAQ
ncbi:tol-pal system protein YbgF [Candidatus Albibeggiatoa sp. nov. NOAA]|uniref:tol-pal system protein YbgF n=1 Tax=Candidatus Albibeggiatoa sp. nov. NOAA TaxID=3162724 RepID=UPI0032F1BCF0|nr:tol-pal system protein YbgF [Thiotrichaceae bacterium]